MCKLEFGVHRGGLKMFDAKKLVALLEHEPVHLMHQQVHFLVLFLR